MSARRTAILVAAGIVLAGAIAALVMLAAGEHRALIATIELPLLVLLASVLLAALVLAVAVAIGAVRGRADRLAAVREAALAEGREAERAAHRRFLARLDHELKNPVTAIRATIAAEADPVSGPTGALATVDLQAGRLARLVGDLRKLADLETRPLERERVDLEALVRDSVAAMAQQHPDAAGRIAVAVTRVPWPIPELALDPDLVALALDNVLGNALKFGGDGPVEVRLREDDGWALVEVADSGRGVPADAVAQVFDELARADNARDVPGSGIGLALVRTVLRRHGGDVELRSREAEGTVVTLRLPAA